MKESLTRKLDVLAERYEEINALLSDREIISRADRFRELSREHAEITPVVSCYADYRATVEALQQAEDMLQDADPQLRELAGEEASEARRQAERIEAELQRLLLPKDPNDQRNIFLEIRAGTGGDEAALFAGDLFRMYQRYAETLGWSIEVMALHEGEKGGFKEIIARVAGRGVYARLKFESGGHRVQRVPETESQGRIHTSACTVAVMPEADEIEATPIAAADLRVDTFRASGAGGQHVNKTDSAVRLTHLPSGIVVECQDERSQHKNRARAMALLQARLLEIERTKQATERADTRRDLIGSGDRSQRIRTYNFPQGRITDHRINLTLYKLGDVMEGDLDQLIEPLIQEYEADQLLALNQ